ncbi:hypothetical protein CTA2_12312 [Colletotrichum tanaceti]|uniref:Uncharacterized protein n=1 Tax=Colletotrichum tanaceti TaxID=1306861 RepID=A0A4V6DGS2_9PEZI|nr:hypothetical protein CTA2_12312 [Colletotrichum tanaceti]TKW53896.1 hypothetical protein CTA1_9669 [Colletotrichum tanaceti]
MVPYFMQPSSASSFCTVSMIKFPGRWFTDAAAPQGSSRDRGTRAAEWFSCYFADQIDDKMSILVLFGVKSRAGWRLVKTQYCISYVAEYDPAK